ncbi:MAG: GNAT family N-acetyltransferase [Rhodospirillum sp.]|nr:GNAT family N-acetyltransferase [Rhodospirillum sp.]MCF8490295.1 GNAT family N-acetyltransferase [Rhodospirillum sp.]MCF8499335.1 GNAT family N-acetyltransferase [Rhodospirillum sp.]
MTDGITIRDANDGDAEAIATLLVQAGEGLYEFLLDGLVPDMGAADLLAHLVETGDSPYGWPECRVAVKDGAVIGMVNAFPVERLDELDTDMIPADRMIHIAPLARLRDPGGFFINAMAVLPEHRSQGIGRKLVAEALGMAGAEGRKRVSLQVWSTNTRAIKLYEEFGFSPIDQLELPHHDRLTARRVILMARGV